MSGSDKEKVEIEKHIRVYKGEEEESWINEFECESLKQ